MILPTMRIMFSAPHLRYSLLLTACLGPMAIAANDPVAIDNNDHWLNTQPVKPQPDTRSNAGALTVKRQEKLIVMDPTGGPTPEKPPAEQWLPVTRSTTAINVKALANRAYYQLPADAVCTANDPARTKLKTWRNKIEFTNNGQMLVWGTICNDNAQQIPWRKLTGKLFITADLKQIKYAGKVFTYSAKLPKLCATGTWCPVQ
jgi:hypothetical protein